MIINFISHYGNRKIFKGIVIILILSFTVMTSSCYTTYESSVNSDIVKPDSQYKIVRAIMKNGQVINLKDKEPVYVIEYKDYGRVVVYTTKDSTGFIKIEDIKSCIVEKEEVDTGLTFLAILGALALATVIIIVIALSINPPKIGFSAR